MSTLTPESFSNPFSYLDAKLAAFKEEKASAKDALKAYGWILRPCHPVSGMWRARRWTKKERTQHLRAPTSAELIRLAQEDFDRRQKKPAEATP